MRALMFGIMILSVGLSSCSEEIVEPKDYTGRELRYTLYQSSDFDYTGTVTVREYPDEGIELNIQLDWDGSRNSDINFPAHLHFGSYDTPDAPMAFMLAPVNSMTLLSQTRIEQLTDGSNLNFESFQNFEGHVKVHLDSEGPDYNVILVAGNVGSTLNNAEQFDASQMTICSPDF
ncbi:hypothetical protein [Algoriphagus antarcticus]|uniref:CHRD domain-containing protein n=1 Tax=Algoriphagus antarcticus TaxID=238540 RepID=A0A3E0DBV5_9BACT|nr:hypothetical protein [Algoriphagus antarcticus]REG79462.1 hypothetical protein C8N25_13110 [Algoriphagus antarcticus]